MPPSRHESVASVGVVASLLLAGCTEAGSESPTVTVSDSAGVPIYEVEVLPRLDDPRFLWKLELERSLYTGAAEPHADPLIYNPQRVMRFEDGTLVVLDAGQERLVIVPPDRDTAAARFGRSGEGPGEVLSANSLFWPGSANSFWLLDPGNGRLTEFTLDGEVVAETPTEIVGMGGLGIQSPVTHRPYFSRFFFSNPTTGELTDSVARFDPEAASVLPFAPMPPRHPSRDRSTARFPYFAPTGTFAPLGAGGVVVGRTDAPVLEHYSDEGALLGVLRLELEQRVIPLSDKPRIIEEIAAEFPPARNATHEDVADRFPIWSQMWGVGDSVFGLEHTGWASPKGDSEIPRGQRVWRLFSVSGSYEGAIRFPVGFGSPYWIDRDRVVGIRRDSLGVATIETYRLTQPQWKDAP